MADTSIPGRTGPLVLAVSTPVDLVPDPGGAAVQNVVPHRGIVISNLDKVDHNFVLRIGATTVDMILVTPSSTFFWPGTIVILNTETLEIELLEAVDTTAPNATASYMRTD